MKTSIFARAINAATNAQIKTLETKAVAYTKQPKLWNDGDLSEQATELLKLTFACDLADAVAENASKKLNTIIERMIDQYAKSGDLSVFDAICHASMSYCLTKHDGEKDKNGNEKSAIKTANLPAKIRMKVGRYSKALCEADEPTMTETLVLTVEMLETINEQGKTVKVPNVTIKTKKYEKKAGKSKAARAFEIISKMDSLDIQELKGLINASPEIATQFEIAQVEATPEVKQQAKSIVVDTEDKALDELEKCETAAEKAEKAVTTTEATIQKLTAAYNKARTEKTKLAKKAELDNAAHSLEIQKLELSVARDNVTAAQAEWDKAANANNQVH